MSETKPSLLAAILDLVKVKITFAVMLTTITGYVLAKNQFDIGAFWIALGLFILACGSAALNQYQEYPLDKKMDRTKNRPIPSGQISPQMALILSIGLSLIGSFIIYFSSGLTALLLSLLTLFWYNVIYTYLKRVTALAVIPGSVIGALPPMVGFAAGGGDIFDFRIGIVAFFFFIWQVPHFWLILVKYSKQYEDAGFPSLTQLLKKKQIINVTFVWVIATTITALMLPAFGIISNTALSILTTISAILLVLVFVRLFFNPNMSTYQRSAFMSINIFSLFMMIFLVADSFI